RPGTGDTWSLTPWSARPKPSTRKNSHRTSIVTSVSGPKTLMNAWRTHPWPLRRAARRHAGQPRRSRKIEMRQRVRAVGRATMIVRNTSRRTKTTSASPTTTWTTFTGTLGWPLGRGYYPRRRAARGHPTASEGGAVATLTVWRFPTPDGAEAALEKLEDL